MEANANPRIFEPLGQKSNQEDQSERKQKIDGLFNNIEKKLYEKSFDLTTNTSLNMSL